MLMSKKSLTSLSRRERQIMDIIFKTGSASVSEVRKLLPDPPSYSAVRALLNILEKKGYLKHKASGPKYVYFPTLSQDKAKHSALKHTMKTFFQDSTESVVAALLDISGSKLTDEELDRLSKLIEQAKKEEK
jgi:predicted transcriptional regulator